MGLVLDLIVIGIILIFALISAKRGFVKVLIETVGFVAAIFIAFSVSTPLANATYDKLIEPPVIAAVSEGSAAGAEDVVTKTWEALPSVITENAEKLGLNIEKINTSINENLGGGVETAAQNASQNVIKPIVVKLLGLLYSVVLSLVLLIIVKPIASFINKLFSFSLVGKLNRTLGGIVGVIQGIVFALVFCTVIALIVSFTDNGFLIFNAANIDSSNIFKFFTEIFR